MVQKSMSRPISQKLPSKCNLNDKFKASVALSSNCVDKSKNSQEKQFETDGHGKELIESPLNHKEVYGDNWLFCGECGSHT